MSDCPIPDNFSRLWRVVKGDINHRLSPGSKMYAKREAVWIVGPEFEDFDQANKYLDELKAAIELIKEGQGNG